MGSAGAINAFYNAMGPGAVRESIINGIWYEAIRQHFPSPGFVIAPEWYTPNNTRVDLCILQVTNLGLRPVFAFEGKQGPMNQNQWATDVGQAAGYIQSMTRLSNGRYYGMLASGQGYVILEYAAGGGHNQVLKVTGGNLALNTSHDTTPWNAQAHANDIDNILGAIAAQVAMTP